MKLEYYKSEQGIYVARATTNYLHRRDKFTQSGYLINGLKPSKTHHPAWVFVEGEVELKTFSVLTTGERENYRYELKETTPDAIKSLTPRVLTLEEANGYYDDVYCEYHISEECAYFEYRSFYNRVFDTLPDYYAEQEIEVKFLGEIESNWVSNPTEAKYSVYRTSWKHEGETTLDISNIASYSELSEMLTEDLLLHNQPCSITSTQTFNIIRKFVNDNINPEWAVVTSDYDFCFTVKKKISIKPYEHITEETKSNGKPYAKRRFNSRQITHKQEQIFEMTHSERNYKGYTPIVGFSGESLHDLVDTIDSYLNELIRYINKPLSECEHCNGTGHILGKQFEVNKR